jgi:aryl sulfotransferase
MPRYRSLVYDSIRWDGFELRRGDIIVSTPPKCGTTWTQMILALIIFQEPVLDTPLSVHSPWLDNVNRARRDVVADLDAQTHRRFIKTHTPLDGLPVDSTVTYLVVGRDPRDVALSMDNHMDNLDIPAFMEMRARAAAIDGIELEPVTPRRPAPDDPRTRFWSWVDDDTPPTEIGSTLLRTLRHIETFRNADDDLDIIFLRYEDLRADLEGEMRGLADLLEITFEEDRWPQLVAAAGFDQMRDQASMMAPNAHSGSWKDNRRFFNRGTSGQWRDVIDDAEIDRYRERALAIGPADVVDWIHPHGI